MSNEHTTTKKSFWGRKSDWITLIYVLIAMKIGSMIGLQFLFIALAGLLGYWLANYMIKIGKRGKYLVLANSFSWLNPMAGILSSVATYQLISKDNVDRKYLWLVYACGALSLINAFWGVL